MIRGSLLLIHRNHPHTRQQSRKGLRQTEGSQRGSSSTHTLDPFLSDTAFYPTVVNLQCTAYSAAQQAGIAVCIDISWSSYIIIYSSGGHHGHHLVTHVSQRKLRNGRPSPRQDPRRWSHCLPSKLTFLLRMVLSLYYLPECHSSITATAL